MYQMQSKVFYFFCFNICMIITQSMQMKREREISGPRQVDTFGIYSFNGVVLQCLQIGVQFLGNFVSGNKDNQDFLWELCFPFFFRCVYVCNMLSFPQQYALHVRQGTDWVLLHGSSHVHVQQHAEEVRTTRPSSIQLTRHVGEYWFFRMKGSGYCNVY